MSICSQGLLTSVANNVSRIFSDVACKATEKLEIAVWFGVLLLDILNSLAIIVPAALFFINRWWFRFVTLKHKRPFSLLTIVHVSNWPLFQRCAFLSR